MDLNLGQLAQIAFSVSDVDKAIDFYGGKLGLKMIFRPHEHMVFFDCGGVALFMEKAGDADAVKGASILYFKCDDIAGASKELEARGVVFVRGPHRIAELPTHDLWMAFFRDPDDHLLALSMQAPKGYALP